ncbi:MAG: hypothetical protein KatS3mg054_1068 [Chloroflexus sp.]|jgi:hypothetical protein|nr:MAG: hypothetical protein KatS3mg054_1068 [Chloroflexus sp.]
MRRAELYYELIKYYLSGNLTTQEFGEHFEKAFRNDPVCSGPGISLFAVDDLIEGYAFGNITLEELTKMLYERADASGLSPEECLTDPIFWACQRLYEDWLALDPDADSDSEFFITEETLLNRVRKIYFDFLDRYLEDTRKARDA